MSFSGFDVGNASLAGSEEAKKGRNRRIKKNEIDPAASMIEEESAPITAAEIERAKKLKEKRLKQAEARKLKQQEARENKARKQASKTEKPTENDMVNDTSIPKEHEDISEVKKLDLAEVKRKQRELEEQNTLRRRALGTEVATRTKNILAEAAKLKKIEDEIKRLDQFLAYDVSILRDKIDSASFEFSKAKNRFDAAEKEYKESKEDYEAKAKTKDDLVESLMTLIQENEERKKVKLEDLTLKLNMTADELAAKEEEEALKAKEEADALKAKEEEEKRAAESERIEEERKLKEAEEKEKNVQSEDKGVVIEEKKSTQKEPDNQIEQETSSQTQK